MLIRAVYILQICIADLSSISCVSNSCCKELAGSCQISDMLYKIGKYIFAEFFFASGFVLKTLNKLVSITTLSTSTLTR